MPSRSTCLRLLILLTLCWRGSLRVDAGELLPSDRSIAEVIDHYVHEKLERDRIAPAPPAPETTLLRRTMLDLVGRTPTRFEAQEFAASNSPGKRVELVDRLMHSPAYVRHNAREFDRLLAAENENAPSLEPYLAAAIDQRKPWNRIFAELFGASDEIDDAAAKFITGRLGDRDSLTRDVSSIFFGVNVSCCQCHNHPTVDYLTQDFYFGLKAFFHRSYEFHGRLMERSFAEPLHFKPRGGEQQDARYLLISGTDVSIPSQVADDLKTRIEEEDKTIARLRTDFGKDKQFPAQPAVVPRRQFVAAVLSPTESEWFARSLVNRLWNRFFGCGLVMRIDQMHPQNPASHPELLAWLARDFIAHGSDLHRLIRGFVLSETYARSSLWERGEAPPASAFAVASLRPLTPMQYGLSLRVASSANSLLPSLDSKALDQKLIQLEEEAKKHFVPLLQEPIEGLQIGINEALRLSNDPELEKLLGEGTAESLMQTADSTERVSRLFWTVLARPPAIDERDAVLAYLAARGVGASSTAADKLARVAEAALQVPLCERQLAEAQSQAKLDALRTLLGQTEALLEIAARQFVSRDEPAAIREVESRGLNLVLYQNWRHFVGLDENDADGDARHVLRNRFTTVLDEVGGNRQVVGLGSLGTPSVIVNQTNEKVQWFPPKRVTVHPSRTQAVVIGWRSPIAGAVTIEALARDLDDGGGNGIAVSVQLVQGRDPTSLAAEPVANGGTFRYQAPQAIPVRVGDIVALTIDPLSANHGFDTTEVNLLIREAGGEQRRWDLNEDVVPSVRENPHVDRYGSGQVWHFALSGKAVTAVPAGSLIAEWNQSLRQSGNERARLEPLGARIQRLLVEPPADSAKEPDRKAREHLTGMQSPLFAGIDPGSLIGPAEQVRLSSLKARLLEVRQRAEEKLASDEQAEYDRARNTWRQVVWSLLSGAEARFNH